MLPPVRPSRALPAPPPLVSRRLSFLLSLQPSALSGVKDASADLFEHPTPTATGSAYQSACVRCSPRWTSLPQCLRILCGGSLHMRARAAAHTVLLATRVVVRVVHCIVQHEQALRLRIAPLRAYTSPCFPLSTSLPAHDAPVPARI
ncbi:hypothetical protein B0H14DRAFT_3447077 [Mycena olivaceomarginata]|nr:hypothetical protein B0H14DRAFT_3447077 [Mycena olivaceomarginata]